MPDLDVAATTVRVPVHTGHRWRSTSGPSPDDVAALEEALRRAPGVEYRAADGSERHPMPLDVEGRDPVLVGRLRAIPERERGFALFAGQRQPAQGRGPQRHPGGGRLRPRPVRLPPPATAMSEGPNLAALLDALDDARGGLPGRTGSVAAMALGAPDVSPADLDVIPATAPANLGAPRCRAGRPRRDGRTRRTASGGPMKSGEREWVQDGRPSSGPPARPRRRDDLRPLVRVAAWASRRRSGGGGDLRGTAAAGGAGPRGRRGPLGRLGARPPRRHDSATTAEGRPSSPPPQIARCRRIGAVGRRIRRAPNESVRRDGRALPR